MKQSINKLIVSILFIFIFIINIANKTLAEENFHNKEYYLKELPDDFALGSKSAETTIIEYSSFSCVHCGFFHKNVFEKIKKEFIDSGKVRWINRQFISDRPSMIAASLAACSNDSNKYFMFLNIFLSKQNSWAFKSNYEDILKNISYLSGMSEADFKRCINDNKIQDFYLKQKRIANQVIEIKGTPIFFMKGKELKIDSFEDFAEKIK